MRLTEKGGLRKVAIYKLYEATKETEEKYQEKHKECERYNKLADLEDIEDELGIDLVTLFKALKDGYYAKYGVDIDGKIEKQIGKAVLPRLVHSEKLGYCLSLQYGNLPLRLKDYGKTWALTKEKIL